MDWSYVHPVICGHPRIVHILSMYTIYANLLSEHMFMYVNDMQNTIIVIYVVDSY